MAMTAAREAIAIQRADLRQAKRQFQSLSEEMQEAALTATTLTAEAIARQAQANILASPSVRTRALHNHIHWQVRKKSGLGRVGVSEGQSRIGGVRVKGIVVAGRGGSARTSQGAKVIRPSRYAHLVEFGTRHSAAEPFMEPAERSQRAAHVARMRAHGAAAVRRVSRSGGGLT